MTRNSGIDAEVLLYNSMAEYAEKAGRKVKGVIKNNTFNTENVNPSQN
ncbi:MAG: hypothetical protein IPF62_04335 [Bacteroidetes bacterium]|nr:hypothetical protein [Bacteroidota bacterium]